MTFKEEEGFDDKLCFVLSEIETLPIILHLSPILAMMQGNLDEVWMQSEQFDLKGLLSKIQKHLIESKKLIGMKSKGVFKKSSSKVICGDQCVYPLSPVINCKHKLFGLLGHFKMLTSTVEKFATYQRAIQKSLNEEEGSSGTKNEVSMFILSWNLAGYVPNLDNDEECKNLLAKMFENMDQSDLIVVNFQEIIEMKANADVMLGLFSQDVKNYKQWAKFFQKKFAEAYPDYIFQNQQNLLGLGVFIFIHKDKTHFINHITTKKVKFGLLGAVPNKGSIIDSYQIYDHIVVFSNSHLPSGEKTENIRSRAEKVDEILRNCSNSSEFHYDLMFIVGDLNLRCYAEFPFETRSLKELETLGEEEYAQKSEQYLKADETRIQDSPHTNLGKIFLEGVSPRFPTYKVIKDSEEAVYVDNRRPSWTDRIFYHNRGKVELEPLVTKSSYIKFSDHLYVSTRAC